jgi:hypothetical protein
MRNPSQTCFPREETIEEIKAHNTRASMQLELFWLKTEVFNRYVREAAIYLESAKLHASTLEETGASPSGEIEKGCLLLAAKL